MADTLEHVASRFASLPPIPLDGPFALDAAFRADNDHRKVNLGIGAYRDDQGRPWVLPSVSTTRERLMANGYNHEYLPLHGNDAFLDASRVLLFGSDRAQDLADSVASIQTVSGTGANSLIARFLGHHAKPRNVWFPDPTWNNHFAIWKENAPNVDQRLYPYYSASTNAFDFDGAMALMDRDAEAGDVMLLHACAHNPTGLDPTKEQWEKIAQLCVKKKLFVVFDAAYQGFASGDLDQDAWAIRHFESYPMLELAVCQSFSKNMGLYGERVGALHVVVARGPRPSPAATVRGNLVQLQRCDLSMAPRFGSQVAAEVMITEHLLQTWQKELQIMSGHIMDMRRALHDELVRLETPGDWGHVIQQTGMFSYTGLDAKHVKRLVEDHHVYLLNSGRISICGLQTGNVKYVAAAICATVRQVMAEEGLV